MAMPKAYRQLPIDMEIHDRLIEVRRKLSEQASSTDALFGVGQVIGLLLDYAAESPPTNEWLAERLKAMPKRGRPRVSDQGHTPALSGDNSKTKAKKSAQHDWCVSSKHPTRRVCRKCPEWDSDGLVSNGFYNPCANTKQTQQKSVLLDAGFTTEELAWLDD
jgi:hypothetical protein